MKTYNIKIPLLALFMIVLAIFSLSPAYALTLNEAQKLLASDGSAGDFYGDSVSISGGTAVIGSRFDDSTTGSAYVYVRDAAGVWSEQQKLTASDGIAGDRFGIFVSISNNTIVVGAIDEGNNSSGSAYVYVRDGAGVWSEQQKLTASDAAPRDLFGGSVSISGDTIVIGAREEDDNGSDSGSAYVFVRDGAGVWSEQQKLIASDGNNSDLFGFSVSNAGDSAIIGAVNADGNANGSGAAYVFIRNAAGVWSEQQKLTASDGASNDWFGGPESVSISGDVAVVGARNNDNNGSAYVYARDGAGVWSEQQKLTASDGASGDWFGESVSVSGDTIIVASRQDDDNGSSSGSAYVFEHDGATWNEQQKLTASDGAAGDRFGIMVSISGDKVVLGAGGDDDNGSSSGSAYIFEGQLLTIQKRINNRVRSTASEAAQLLVGTRYSSDYKVTNNSPNRLYRVRVFENGQLVCNLYDMMPGQSKQPASCVNSRNVLAGLHNVPANVTAKVSGSNQTLSDQTDAYYMGFGDTPGKLSVTHFVNNKNADTPGSAASVIGNQAEITFRVENTGSIKLYRVKTYHDPQSPVNSGWQQQCFFGTLDPGQVRYCKRTINVNQDGLNKAFGRAQGEDANVNPTSFINASNPSYFNVVLP